MFSKLKKPHRAKRTQSAPVIHCHRELTSDEDETVGQFSIGHKSVSLPPRLVTTTSHQPPSSFETTSRCRDRNHPLVKALVAALQKEHMLDVTLVGREGVQVRASRYVLACRCEKLEKKLYHSGTHPQVELVHLGDYTDKVLRGFVEYCFTGELVEFSSGDWSPSTVTDVIELFRMAQDYCFRLLKNEVYQLARKVMNCRPPLATLFYNDAASDIQSYARQTLLECSREALFADESFVDRLSAERIEGLVGDLEELDAIKLCAKWMATTDAANATEVARRLASTIDLTELHMTDNVQTILKESGLFDDDTIRQATKSACKAKERMNVDRVLVEGAGEESVNGIYYRSDEDEEECMYVKDCGTMGLHCWNNRWHIGRTYDLSHSLYISTPMGWRSVLTEHDPPPDCTWMPKVESRVDSFDLPTCFPLEQD